METKHTAGPWKWKQGFIKNTAYNILMGDNGKRIILKTQSPVGNDLDLIAQAPDLLAKVQELKKYNDEILCADHDKHIKIEELNAKVSEEEKEIERLRDEIKDSDQAVEDNYKMANIKNVELQLKVSEQSQRITEYRQKLFDVLERSKKYYYLPHSLEDEIEALLSPK